MKILIVISVLVVGFSVAAAEESPSDIAKRVIADKSQAFTSLDIGGASLVSGDVRDPKDDELNEAAKKAGTMLETYMLGDSVPEKIRIAYAIGILATKRIPTTGSHQYGFGNFDKEKNDGFLRDALVLSARLAEIKQAEQGSAGQPATAPESKPDGGEKPKPESVPAPR